MLNMNYAWLSTAPISQKKETQNAQILALLEPKESSLRCISEEVLSSNMRLSLFPTQDIMATPTSQHQMNIKRWGRVNQSLQMASVGMALFVDYSTSWATSTWIAACKRSSGQWRVSELIFEVRKYALQRQAKPWFSVPFLKTSSLHIPHKFSFC